MSAPEPAPFHRLGGSDGQPEMVLIHGFGADRLSWLANAPQLATAFKLWAVELPGHGDAEPGSQASLDGLVDAVLAGLAKHTTGAVHLVGHSLGGAVALRLAAGAPERIRSLVLIAPAGLGRGIDPDFAEGFGKLDDADAALALLQRLVARPRLINKPMAAHVLAHLDRPGRREAVTAIAAFLPALGEALADTVAVIAGSGLPRLTIWGEEDRINPLDRDRLARFGGEQHILPATGHMPQIEEIKAVNGWIQTFVTAHA